MGHIADVSLFVASTDELRAAAPGWKRPLAEPARVQLINPFTPEPVEILSTNPVEPFDAGTPTKLDPSKLTFTALERFEHDDIEHLANMLCGKRLLSATDAEEARVFDVPLYGPIDPSSDGVFRVLPQLVECLARLSVADVEACTEEWVRRQKGGWHERDPNARVEQDWEDQFRVFTEMSRRAVSENRHLFQRLAFRNGQTARRRSRAYYGFPRHDFHRLFLRLTPTCRDALDRARRLPPHRQERNITIDHLLVTLVDDVESDFSLQLAHHGFEPEAVRAVFAEEFEKTAAAGALPPFGNVLRLLVDTYEAQAFSSRLVRMRSQDLLFELFNDPGRYGFGWIKKRLGTLASRTKFRLVRLEEHAKEARESRLSSLV